MKIGQLSAQFGVSTHTLRYYEKIGLLAGGRRDPSGHRIYDDSDVETLMFVRRAQTMNFSLNEIQKLLDIASDRELNKPAARELVTEKLDEVNNSIAQLSQLRKELSNMLTSCQESGSDSTCPIIENLRDTESQ